MKLKNVKKGDLLYLKTYEEVRESKYFCYVDSDGDVHFLNGIFYSKKGDVVHGGKLVRATDIDGDDIIYMGGCKQGVSRHAFRKPTESELEEYHGGK